MPPRGCGFEAEIPTQPTDFRPGSDPVTPTWIAASDDAAGRRGSDSLEKLNGAIRQGPIIENYVNLHSPASASARADRLARIFEIAEPVNATDPDQESMLPRTMQNTGVTYRETGNAIT